MKNLSPIKRHPALVSFSRDHHFGLLLVWKIRQGLSKAVNAERIANYVLYAFENDLRQHFSEEENLMFNKLPAGDPLRKQAENEHTGIYSLVEKLRSDKTNEQLLTQFAQNLQDHIRFEERILFTYMQEKLGAADLETIATYNGTEPGNIDTRWEDLFWEKKITPVFKT
ncbi:MAG: hemerythrin domain-containing protein [Ferruginibacter sp.]